MPLDAHTLSRLKSQIASAELVLFTGAGFSTAARDREGRNLPTVLELKRELWALCFPTDPYDDGSSLGDLYDIAARRHPLQLATFLESRLSIDGETLPAFYEAYFNAPWHRVYTLNVDDLPSAVARRFDLRRPPVSISATAREDQAAVGATTLEVIHLNGMCNQPPAELTFSDSQYAQRIANHEPWYARCATDIIARPVIFIGTELREVPLWQHMELRKRRFLEGRDLRPASLLVTRPCPHHAAKFSGIFGSNGTKARPNRSRPSCFHRYASSPTVALSSWVSTVRLLAIDDLRPSALSHLSVRRSVPNI